MAFQQTRGLFRGSFHGYGESVLFDARSHNVLSQAFFSKLHCELTESAHYAGRGDLPPEVLDLRSNT